MGLFDSFGSGNYQVAQGLPGFTQGVYRPDINRAYEQTQGGLDSQRNFMQALIGGNGLNPYQSQIFGQQQGLASQFQQQALGQGPNPAQALLAQNTGQNVQQQAALMGSARGAQSNPGLMARQAAIQGGGIQQQAQAVA